MLAENSTDMISRHSPDMKFLYVSPACQTILGYSPSALMRRSAYEFFHPEDCAARTGLRHLARRPGTTALSLSRTNSHRSRFGCT
ncbi:MAG: PAS domain S-box protein, partial [Hormoscilla sp. SP12CHS1]|nr:PAS domain S-box protein [Hormoscilla sp. SP12CHS1]